MKTITLITLENSANHGLAKATEPIDVYFDEQLVLESDINNNTKESR